MKPRILVVEDDSEMRALIRESLGQSFDVTEAGDADEAVRLSRKPSAPTTS